jgi:hypothetical protein
MSPELSENAVLVLMAVHDREGSAPGTVLPLRSIAVAVLGAEESAVRALTELDLVGQLRTDVMGWRRGRLTDSGRALAQALRTAATPAPDRPERS